MSEPQSRFVEMLDATIARKGINMQGHISPSMPMELKIAVAAVCAVKLALYSRLLPQGMYEDLREDFSYVLLALLGKKVMQGPEFKLAYDTAGKDILDALARQRMGG